MASSVEVLDLSNLIWSIGESMPMPVTYAAGLVLNGKFYVIGGKNYDIDKTE